VLWLAAIAAPRAAPGYSALDGPPELHDMSELSGAPLDRLNRMLEVARGLAAADDTYEFISRPNIPYVLAHYAPDRLDADRIDTVLIVNSRGQPLFWRRLHHARNRGFTDARAFLAALPVLPAPGAAGTPGIAAAAMVRREPDLIVALPIYRSDGLGNPRGWLIAASTLDAAQWRSIGLPERIPQTRETRETRAAAGPVMPERVRSTADGAVTGTASSARSTVGLTFLIVLGGISALIAWRLKASRPEGRGPETLAPAPAAPLPPRSLSSYLTAGDALVCYQPQIDLRTGQVAGVEALLCVRGPQSFEPATHLMGELQAAGLECALFEHTVREACRMQRFWQRQVGHDFAIGIALPRRLFEDPATLAGVERALAEAELEPSMLELEVEEGAIGANPAALARLASIHAAGIGIAIDGFNATHSLRQLISVPIAKLRVDPGLLQRMSVSATEALLFDGILASSRSLGIIVCASGLDTAELLAAVLEHGRPLAQGGAVGAPLRSEDFLELLRGSDQDTATLRPLNLSQAQPEAATPA
jgi:EAL domain-containing protein (putative c-di-GMP-specific phosphodiesterase class I)